MIFLFSLFLAFFSLHADDRSEITVQLRAASQLPFIYIGETSSDPSLDAAYVRKLEEILIFDFNLNGFTKVLPRSAEREICLASQEIQMLKKVGASYVMKARIFEKALSLTLFSLSEETVRQFDGFALTGNPASDRTVIHKAADSIYKSLTGKDGIATTRILFSMRPDNHQGHQGKEWAAEIWECDYDGENLRQVTKEGTYAISPVYFPSKPGYASTRFLYVSYKYGQPKIYIASLKEGCGKNLIALRGNQLLPALSPRRDKIAFISDADGRADLFMQTISPETGALGKPFQLFTAPRSVQASPTFSPDGTKIAFVSDKDGKPRIYLIDIPKKEGILPQPKLLTSQNPENSCPSWSPDGTKLAYSAKTNGTRQIWIYDFATHTEWQLTEGGGHKENPCWAPDSLHLVFNSTDPNSSELYLVNLRQAQAVRISRGSGKKHYPSWEPRNY